MKQHILFALFILTAPLVQAQVQNDQMLDRIVAVVGDEIITESELQMQILQATRANPQSEDPSLTLGMTRC